MCDLIYSTKSLNRRNLIKAFETVYKNVNTQVSYFEGTWGSLAFSKNIYNGFDPLITEEYIMIVLGGPILKYQNNNFINENSNNKGTKSIFQRWKNGDINWHEDLSGPFHIFIINKIDSKVFSVTDIMSFIPIYSCNYNNAYYISSHVDMLAQVTNNYREIDEVSLVDFIYHGIITYPYTFYKDINQIKPAATHKITEKGILSKSYWIPKEENNYATIGEAAIDLREKLISYIDTVISETSNVAQFISGGEDSRALSGLLKDVERDAFIYLDSRNREGKLAKKVTEKYNATYNLRIRSNMHYLDILPDCTDLLGMGSEYHHAHTYGFHKELESYDAVFGGLFSDALLKGARIKKTRITMKLPFLKQVKDNSFSNANQINSDLFDNKLVEELNVRRTIHLDRVKKFRNDSAEEWFELWPSSMNRNIPNIHANRRLFKSYEPFLSNEIVKISASVKQEWKLNRLLFYRSVKPLLKPSKFVLHGDGWLPYLSWKPNTLIRFSTWTVRQILKRLKLTKGNQGPWAEWSTLINTEKWNEKLMYYFNSTKVLSPTLKGNIECIIKNKELTVLQYIALTQVLYKTSLTNHKVCLKKKSI